MDITVRSISQKCQEVKILDGQFTFESGLLDHKEAIDVAETMLNAASELLRGANKCSESDVIDFVVEKL